MSDIIKKSNNSFNIKSFLSKDNLPLLSLIFLVVYTVVAIVLSCALFKINVVVACVMVILEAGLVACLNRIPIWVHGLVFIAQIVCGIIASQVPFMLLMAFVYAFAVTFFFIWANR
ncbi:hypothetical protein SAMN02910384_00421 [Pseudobutyrivibrio sp. ACV-2]|uniref:hypothetical protein n=1 Tax=Pseudobutyrivibrio sp. ACV-2 TaxID=1520801 RepID=UPI0008996FB5|nr:hypothetical protein [Pseudobutyrivibrio sp. ACV-2]SDZ87907.1 hypothetical protein SAMN02910384_00421 [Pseudobutyrivibrio sp. ACV-2]